MTGSELIAAERQRQVDEDGENWTEAHDDQHAEEELARAAACYAMPDTLREMDADDVPEAWPWEWDWWKPEGGRIRQLVKAGALIAAEIDRLQRRCEPCFYNWFRCHRLADRCKVFLSRAVSMDMMRHALGHNVMGYRDWYCATVDSEGEAVWEALAATARSTQDASATTT
jgi:hypothetical protein